MNQYPTICGKCDASLRESSYNTDRAAACPQCYTPAWAYVYPAWKKEVDAQEQERADLELGEASCFNHESRKASAICDDCGKFLCGLCAISYSGRQICTDCVSAEKAGGATLKQSAKRPDVQAMWLALIALFVPFLGFVLSGFSLYLVFKHWKRNESYIAYSKWRYVVAAILSGLAIAMSSLMLVGAIVG